MMIPDMTQVLDVLEELAAIVVRVVSEHQGHVTVGVIWVGHNMSG